MTDVRHSDVEQKQLVDHLKDVTNELTSLHSDLYWLAMNAPNSPEKPDAAAELNVEMLAELKTAVDNMRLILWKYIETASELDPESTRQGLEAERVRSVTRFLQLLRDRLGPAVSQQPMSFIERISAAVKERLGDKAA